MQNAYIIAAAKPATLYLLGTPRGRLENNIKMNGGETDCENQKWMELSLLPSPMTNLGTVVAEPLDSATIRFVFKIIQCATPRFSRTIK